MQVHEWKMKCRPPNSFYFFLVVGFLCGVDGRPEFTPWYWYFAFFSDGFNIYSDFKHSQYIQFLALILNFNRLEDGIKRKVARILSKNHSSTGFCLCTTHFFCNSQTNDFFKISNTYFLNLKKFL